MRTLEVATSGEWMRKPLPEIATAAPASRCPRGDAPANASHESREATSINPLDTEARADESERA